jgi:hypothetical protein
LERFLNRALDTLGHPAWNVSDGVSDFRVIERTRARLSVCGLVWDLDNQELHLFWLECGEGSEADVAWTLYFEGDDARFSPRRIRNAVWLLDAPEQMDWQHAITGRAALRDGTLHILEGRVRQESKACAWLLGMCWWLTVGTSKPDVAIAALREAGLHVERADHAAVAVAFPSGLALLDVTYGGCSCDLWIADPVAEGAALASMRAEREKSLRARYERKGWKAAKIERALKSARLVEDAKPKPRAEAAVAALAALSASQRIFLFFRPVSGLATTEVPSIAGRRRLTRDEYLAARGIVPERTVIELGA